MVTVAELEVELDKLAVSGEMLYTRAKNKPFRVVSIGKGRYFLPDGSQKLNAAICPAYFARLVDIFNSTNGSLAASDYRPPTAYGGYYCAVLSRL